MIFKFLFIFLWLAGHLLSSEHRRIGVRHDVDNDLYFDLGRNYGAYVPSDDYPNLSLVGALISESGALGTATLVAANHIITAAHVVKNTLFDDPNPTKWQFILHHDYGESSSSDVYHIEEINIHPGWTARQEFTEKEYGNPLGDGDILGLDLALLKLNRPVVNLYPARLPCESDDPVGLRTVHSGFGILVNGYSGAEDSSVDRRLGGENIIDRSVARVSFDNGIDSGSYIGGLLGMDFDSIDGTNNSLSKIFTTSNSLLKEARQVLGSGDSQASPMNLEASTAVGDSGGPAFVLTRGTWRIHGVVSYGTADSTYGDVTLYTRLATHYNWLINNLPNWADSKVLESTGWLENPWFGKIFPTNNKWVFSQNLGWLYIPTPLGNYFWAWSDLLKKWVWLADESFPFLYYYTPTQSSWYYILLDYSNGSVMQVYDYSTLSWRTYTGS